MNIHKSGKAIAAYIAIPVFLGLTYWLLTLVPAVKGLGTNNRLPMFHGASTWVDLMILTFMGLLAIYGLLRRTDAGYGWEVGLRTVGVVMWFANAAMGYIAARMTWDFTGWKESPVRMILGDPRLMTQIYLALGAAVLVIAVAFLLEKRWQKRLADLVYAVAMWVLMVDLFIDPVKRALHPDSPVLSSDEWIIKAPFFGMVATLLVAHLVVAWIVSTHIKPETPELEKVADSANA